MRRVISISIDRRPGGRKYVLMLAVILVLLAIIPVVTGKYLHRAGVDRITISAVDFPAAVNIENKQDIKSFLRGLSASVSGGDPAKTYRNAKYEFSLYRGSTEEKYIFNDHLSFYYPAEKKQYLASPRLKDILFRAIQEMELANPYGEFLEWQEVKKIFPRYAYATVIDIATGLRFKVQRRAGSHHADVQPLTADDTAIMKHIFGGEWTWRRRAIIVESAGRRLAGSMNGRPHGAGAIAGNNFRGHFCIHFQDSKTHGSNQVDLAHQMMVWKAAGKTEEMLRLAAPEQMMWTFFTAIEQGEYALAARMVDNPQPGDDLQEYFKQITAINVTLLKSAGKATEYNAGRQNYGERVDLPVKISWQGKKTGAHKNIPVTISLIKSKGTIPWLLSRESLKPFVLNVPVRSRQL